MDGDKRVPLYDQERQEEWLTKLSISFWIAFLDSLVSDMVASSSSNSRTDDLIVTASSPYVFCHLVAPTSSIMDLYLLPSCGGTMGTLRLYRLGRTTLIRI